MVHDQIFQYKNNSRLFSLPKNVDFSNIAYLILESVKDKEIWVSKIHKRKYTNYIWISEKIKKLDKFKVIRQICINEPNEGNISTILRGNLISRRVHKNKVLVLGPLRSSYFIVKDDIKLNSSVAWLIGFYFAEGNKNKDYIGFSNQEISLLKKSIEIFEEKFGISKSNWNVFIYSNKKDTTKIKEYWRKRLNTNVKLRYLELAKKEVVEFRINGRILSSILRNYFESFIEKILTIKKLTESFLQGYAIGDGGIILRKKQVHSIAITVKNKEYFNYLIKAFILLYDKKPNIRITKGCYELTYCHVNLITKIILSGIFKDLNRQWKKLIMGYKNKQYTRARIKYWGKIVDEPLKSLEIAELSGNSHWSVSDALNKDVTLGLVDPKYRKTNKPGPPRKHYVLSTKGVELLNILKEVK